MTALPARHSESRSFHANIKELNSFLGADARRSGPAIVHRSRVMEHVLAQGRRFARSNAHVLLTGESGTGKELLARLLYEQSHRADRPYLRVSCPALPEHLWEAELFGHVSGAFPGAEQDRPSRFEAAAGGTLLLDEISEIPLAYQAKLLRVLEEREFHRVGSNTMLPTDVRVIATTNRALDEAVAKGKFRADLYYRLNVLEIRLPPLRERREDIAPLALHFLEQFRAEASIPLTEIAAETLELLTACDWPGNVRQLRNAIHRACLVNSTGVLAPIDLPPLETGGSPTLPIQLTNMRLEEIERCAILANLRKFNGNKTAAAEQLGVTSRTLSNKMRQYRKLGYA